ncbi:hypothetical protein SDJN02_26469 [Cucurbita argyrosperma subsp. argyrosperma]|nr:hypothetical protein SDJN02_26469 [Cucurbita argyrosperma subsp. argyrosperma]
MLQFSIRRDLRKLSSFRYGYENVLLFIGKEVVSQVPLTTNEEFKAAVSAAKLFLHGVILQLQLVNKLWSSFKNLLGETSGCGTCMWNGIAANGVDVVNAICDDEDIKAISFVGSNIVSYLY